MKGGPDAARYIHLAQGGTVPRPFHLRWLLPKVCGTSPVRWWAVWLASWPVMAAAMFWWRFDAGDTWQVSLAAAAILAGLAGILGPAAVIPVGVDLPATALSLAGVAMIGHGWTVAGIGVLCGGAAIRETVPVWAALWIWSPWPLIALLPVAVRHFTTRTGLDPLGAYFDDIAAHPIRAALAAHEGRWRDGWLMVAPWGACLFALTQPTWPMFTVVALAYLQLLVATDTVRLLHHAAGPVLAASAAQVVPPHLLLIVCVAHFVWWRTPERI